MKPSGLSRLKYTTLTTETRPLLSSILGPLHQPKADYNSDFNLKLFYPIFKYILMQSFDIVLYLASFVRGIHLLISYNLSIFMIVL